MTDDVEILKKQFLEIKSKREIADLLNIQYSKLVYHIHKLPEEKKYAEFSINKRNGGVRKIIAPCKELKYIQRNLNDILQKIFPPKKAVHGFVLKKDIKSNALRHVGKKYIVNIDLKDFFPSINFGRVRGLFLAYPFKFNPEVATTLAQICCFKNQLPQGAPTSPIVSNLICLKLDNQFMDLCYDSKCTYTRYADDITFSTNLKLLPEKIGKITAGKIQLSDSIMELIKTNGFVVNEVKIRYALRQHRQEVTGLIVNKFVNVNRKYIKHIRCMLHAWKAHGIKAAAKEHFEKYNVRFKMVANPEESFVNELVGKIGFVGYIKGKGDSVYKKLREKVTLLAPNLRLKVIQDAIEEASNPVIYGEGKTDWRHFKNAFNKLQSQGKFKNTFLTFHEYSEKEKMSNSELLQICKSLSKLDFNGKKFICIFDGDVKSFNRQIVSNGKMFKHWGNNVFSVLIPPPPHRNFEEVCIEHYYSDNDLLKKDSNNRRIYLSTEFNKNTGMHETEELKCTQLNQLQSDFPKIIGKVVNKQNDNVALSKNDFSKYIIEAVPPFDLVSVNNFTLIFDIIKEIVDLEISHENEDG